LLAIRQERAPALPVQAEVGAFGERVLGLLFPHFSSETFSSAEEIEKALRVLRKDLLQVLLPLDGQLGRRREEVADTFFAALPSIHDALWIDAKAINDGDPAAESIDEVVSAYPGFYAIAIHRIAHEFQRIGVPIFPRILSELAHQRTGIDIHPGATIGPSLCIDHGTGIVIGETTTIGARVKLYQGVTLGALSVDKSLSSSKRHPTIEDDVVIYSNATILGGETLVGHDSVIGGNVWLTRSVPPFTVVVNTSEIQVRNRDRVPTKDDVL
jgi:serine O-acetyltransferase